MTIAEILAELPDLNCEELAQIQRKLYELTGGSRLDEDELNEKDKVALDEAWEDYKKNPTPGRP